MAEVRESPLVGDWGKLVRVQFNTMLQVKIASHQVAKGMYIANLDRPWIETPFLFQGFLVQKESEIRHL